MDFDHEAIHGRAAAVHGPPSRRPPPSRARQDQLSPGAALTRSAFGCPFHYRGYYPGNEKGISLLIFTFVNAEPVQVASGQAKPRSGTITDTGIQRPETAPQTADPGDEGDDGPIA